MKRCIRLLTLHSASRLTVFFAVSLLPAVSLAAQDKGIDDVARWERQAQNVTIPRDDWGIPHVYEKSACGSASPAGSHVTAQTPTTQGAEVAIFRVEPHRSPRR